jgi:oxygen-independent coproporphyrinogen-3 oxidase
VNWPGLLRILAHIAHSLAFQGDICVELHPASMADDCLHALKDAGVTMVSVGVESTHDQTLAAIGRSHDGATALDATCRAVRAGFKGVNVDLMFALPGQTVDDWRVDVRTAIDCGADQLSTYPMFAFPYSELGRSRSLTEVRRPPRRLVRTMLEFTDMYCETHGLRRCAVWSWVRPHKQKFSSITRHHYIGFGPSAASMTGSDFYVNTFDVAEFARRLPTRRPIAVSMPVSRRVEMAYWLYWRIYELHVSAAEFQSLFGRTASLDREFGHLLKLLVRIGLLQDVDGSYMVTTAGAYWIHRLQNEYSLSYINHLWGTCRREPWPACVTL